MTASTRHRPEVRRETRDAIVLTLDVAEHSEAFRFPGAVPDPAHQDRRRGGAPLLLDLRRAARADSCGSASRRSRAACSRPGPTSGSSPGPGDRGHAAHGQLPRAARSARRRHYVGFAAGSGITPLLSIVKTTLPAEPHQPFTLFYGNRASSTIMFREELEDLKNEHLDRFALIHILSREQQDIELFNGRIDKAKCEQLLDHWLDSLDRRRLHLRSAGHDAAGRRQPARSTGSTSAGSSSSCSPRPSRPARAQGPSQDRVPHRAVPGDGHHRRPLARDRVREEQRDRARRGPQGGHGAALSPARAASARPAGRC